MVEWLKKALLSDRELDELREARRKSKAEREEAQGEHLERTRRVREVCHLSTQRFNAPQDQPPPV